MYILEEFAFRKFNLSVSIVAFKVASSKSNITWMYQVVQKETGLLTSHSTTKVLEPYYIGPQILLIVEKGAVEIKIFGEDSSLQFLTFLFWSIFFTKITSIKKTQTIDI